MSGYQRLSENGQKAVAMALAGKSRAEIAAETGLKLSGISACLSLGRKLGHDVPLGKPGPILRNVRRQLHVSGPLHARLLEEANARDVTVHELASAILSAAVDDDLINAILDDDDDDAVYAEGRA